LQCCASSKYSLLSQPTKTVTPAVRRFPCPSRIEVAGRSEAPPAFSEAKHRRRTGGRGREPVNGRSLAGDDPTDARPLPSHFYGCVHMTENRCLTCGMPILLHKVNPTLAWDLYALSAGSICASRCFDGDILSYASYCVTGSASHPTSLTPCAN
jgi:hypothetical protein